MTTHATVATESVPESEFQAIAALGLNFYQQGRLQDAETLFRFLLLLHPNAYYAHAGLGVVAMSQQPPNLAEAYESLSKAAALNADDPSVQASLGEVLLGQAKLKEAALHLRRAVELDSQQNDPGANRARAILHRLSGMADDLRKFKASNAA